MRAKAHGKQTRGVPKPPKDFGEFENGLPTRSDVLRILEAYHERTVVPFVLEQTAPWWRKAWWSVLDLGEEIVKRWHALRKTGVPEPKEANDAVV